MIKIAKKLILPFFIVLIAGIGAVIFIYSITVNTVCIISILKSVQVSLIYSNLVHDILHTCSIDINGITNPVKVDINTENFMPSLHSTLPVLTGLKRFICILAPEFNISKT